MKIFLVGFMGSGKTYWGKQWAAKTGLPFFDLDDIIEKQEGKTIADIFQQHGEQWFRQKETEVLHSFSAIESGIISCGGGTPCFNDNMHWMNQHGTSIYLTATPEQIADRLIHEKQKRPLVKDLHADELLTFIANKLKERDVFYSTATIILPVATASLESINELV
jgi:shikimate kinase